MKRSRKALRKRHRRERAAIERIIADGGYARGNLDRRQRGAFERIIADGGQLAPLGKSHRRE